MPASPIILRRSLSRYFACVVAAGFVWTTAFATDFHATLSTERQATTGLTKLSPEQTARLNTLVARELEAARQGNVRAFAGTFTGRRTATERTATGLDLLSASETDSLNEAVATALAIPPSAVSTSFSYRQREAEVEPIARKLKVHGELTLTYGTGRDGSYRSAGIYTEVTDPDRKVTVGLGIETFRGDFRTRCLPRYGDRCYDRGW